jgi:hypothetical protein
VDDFVAYPSRWRIALIVLGAITFVALGFWIIGAFGEMPMSRRYSPVFLNAIGWLSIVFFGACGIVGAQRFFVTEEELRISKAGIRWQRWSDKTIPWSEITDVTTWSHQRQRFIVLHLRDPARFPGGGVLGMAARANRALTGGHIGISMTAMDRSFDDAMNAIERLRR